MNKAYLKALCEYAERQHLQKAPVELVLGWFRTRKPYVAPRTKTRCVKYPKVIMSYQEMEDLKASIILRKNAIQEILKRFGISVDLIIGGSLSLKYQVRSLRDRYFHDIDFIITVDNENRLSQVRDTFKLLKDAGLGRYCNTYYEKDSSFLLGSSFWWAGKEHPINLVINDEPISPFRTSTTFNAVSEIYAAKRKYIMDAKARHTTPRWKDYIDLYKMEDAW